MGRSVGLLVSLAFVTLLFLLSEQKALESISDFYLEDLDHIPTNNTTTNTTHDNHNRPRNLNLAIVGDSISRHQHLSLVYYLHTGRWDPDSLYLHGGHPTYVEYLNSIRETLLPHQACNCHRPEGNYKTSLRLSAIYENMYYHDPLHNNSITFLLKFGKFPAQGHWDPPTVYDPSLHRSRATQPHTPARGPLPRYTWRGNWTYVVRHYLAQLQPTPRYVVFNAGIWPHDLDRPETQTQLPLALHDQGMVGIYKTTTKKRNDRTTTLETHDEWGCSNLEHCLNLSWTGTLLPEDYTDEIHFQAPVYAKMNQQLLELLEEDRRA
jgi:hypothetical protein